MFSDEQRNIAALMIQELDQLKLSVCVVPDGWPNSHRGIRCVVLPNPDWYSRMCAQYLVERRNRRWKRLRTNIKRFFVRQTLDLISKGFEPLGKYRDACVDAINWVIETRVQLVQPPPHFGSR